MTRITAPACENRVRRNNALPSTLLRWCKFNFVGGIGIGVQFAALFLLKGVLHINYLAATAMAVEAAVLHNFVWHERFTWADRTKLSDGENRAKQRRVARLLRFHLSNGAVSIVGNVALMKVLVGQAHMNYLVAQRDRDQCLLAGKFPGKRNLGLRAQLRVPRLYEFTDSLCELRGLSPRTQRLKSLRDLQHNLPVILPVLQQLERLHRPLQRENVADLWRQLTLSDPC